MRAYILEFDQHYFVMQADEKKFFLQPSLGAKAGARLDQKPHAKKSFHRREKLGGKTYTLKLHFEAAPILQLRKILVPSNPTHAQIIAASSNARQQAARDSLAGPKGQVSKNSNLPQLSIHSDFGAQKQPSLWLSLATLCCADSDHLRPHAAMMNLLVESQQESGRKHTVD